MTNEDSHLDGREKLYRSKARDVINYKEYLEHLPNIVQKVMKDRPPEAIHYFEPSELVAKAIQYSFTKSGIHPDGYRIEWFENRLLVMTVALLTDSDETFIAILKYIKDQRETVILITAKDAVVISSQIDDICSKLRENLTKQLRKWEIV